MTPNDSWQPYQGGETLGQGGSEDGIIVLDEDFNGETRITLETEARTGPYAITCGISTLMIHTRYFADEDEARAEYEQMKIGLARIERMIAEISGPDADQQVDAIHQAVERFIEQFP